MPSPEPSRLTVQATEPLHRSSGQVNIIAALLLVAAVVAGVWIWKRLPLDIQDYLVDYTFPALLATAVVGTVLWMSIGAIRRRRKIKRQRERLIGRFEQLTSQGAAPEKRLEIAFALIELNEYELAGLEPVAAAMSALLITTLKTALGDKQHRTRGMAASYLGVLQDRAAIPPLLKALEDDHAYVRSCAALGLGRLRAGEAKAKLAEMMTEDWDQTVRSRAREALERLA